VQLIVIIINQIPSLIIFVQQASLLKKYVQLGLPE
jgi:hypothetical protein